MNSVRVPAPNLRATEGHPPCDARDRHCRTGPQTDDHSVQGPHRIRRPLAEQGVVQELIVRPRIHIFGAAGVSDDLPLAYFWAWARVLRIVDGPDAVHRHTITRQESR